MLRCRIVTLVTVLMKDACGGNGGAGLPHADDEMNVQLTVHGRPSLDALGWKFGTDKASYHSYTVIVMQSQGRARAIKADQSREDDLRKLKEIGPWTVVVDDGSHVPQHQLLTFQRLFPTVVPGGLYIIEDIETSYWKKRGALIYGYPINGKVDMVDMFRRTINGIINSELTCPIVKPPIFSSEIDPMISAVTFIRNAIIVRKMPQNFIRHGKYAFPDKIPCLAHG